MPKRSDAELIKDFDIVWAVANDELPGLLMKIEEILNRCP